MKLKGNPCVSLPAVLINMGCFVKGGLCEVTVSKVICLYCITMDRKKKLSSDHDCHTKSEREGGLGRVQNEDRKETASMETRLLHRSRLISNTTPRFDHEVL